MQRIVISALVGGVVYMMAGTISRIFNNGMEGPIPLPGGIYPIAGGAAVITYLIL